MGFGATVEPIDMTTIRADVNNKFKYKYLIIGVLATAYGLYCVSDAALKYPSMRPKATAYEQLRAEVTDDGEFQRQWNEMAESKGWTVDLEYTNEQLSSNTIYSYFMFGLCALIGVPSLLTGLKCIGQWIEADDKSLVNAKGQRVNFDQIKSIDKTKWEKKGIARLVYDDDGAEKSFVMDDLKFDRQSADEIMERIEAAVGVDKIVGGLSEETYREKRAEAEKEKAARRAALDAEQE